MSNTAEIIEMAGTQVAEFNEFESKLAEYRARYEGVVYDLSVPEQERQAKSDKLSIGKVISSLDARHRDIKAPLKARVDLLDGERKRIKDQLLGLQDQIKEQIAEYEAKIQAEKDALLRRASVFRDLREFEFKPTAEQVEERINRINSMEIDDSYGEMKAFAALNKVESLQILEPLLAGLNAQAEAERKAELERVEAEAKARQEREERIAKEAAGRATAEAAEAIANMEREAKEAAARADREKAEAVERAEREAAERANKAEMDRLAAIEKEESDKAKREANQKHLAKINNAAAAALVTNAAISKDQAQAVIVAIAKKQIPAVSISY